MKSANLVVKSAGAIVSMPAAAVVEAVKLCTDAIVEHARIVQTETTARSAIAADRDVALEEIRAKRALLELYIRERFAERRASLDGFLRGLDSAIEARDLAMVQVMADSIVKTVSMPALGDVATLKDRLNDGTFTFKRGGAAEG